MTTATTLRGLLGGGQSITTSGTSAQATDKAPVGCSEVRVICLTADAYVRFDSDSSAACTTSDIYMVAGSTEYFGIPDDAYVSALQVSEAGTIKLHWMVD